MPINCAEYHPKWRLISKLIRYRRAGNKCEKCSVENGSEGWRFPSGNFYTVDDIAGAYMPPADESAIGRIIRRKCIKIVLTVAHLDHDTTNNRFTNLAALCQRCHLRHDLPQHIENRRYGRHWKRSQLKLF